MSMHWQVTGQLPLFQSEQGEQVSLVRVKFLCGHTHGMVCVLEMLRVAGRMHESNNQRAQAGTTYDQGYLVWQDKSHRPLDRVFTGVSQCSITLEYIQCTNIKISVRHQGIQRLGWSSEGVIGFKCQLATFVRGIKAWTHKLNQSLNTQAGGLIGVC